ncbi:hypothetical protein KSF78_0000329 [Schistosoma japonicum]|nr:hypothetical protein KSF78_0000329 [Schistosoma japonicum]KAH8849869.1 hypothetical protein KSF78_0000329 [Schistosoma japonicum]
MENGKFVNEQSVCLQVVLHAFHVQIHLTLQIDVLLTELIVIGVRVFILKALKFQLGNVYPYVKLTSGVIYITHFHIHVVIKTIVIKVYKLVQLIKFYLIWYQHLVASLLLDYNVIYILIVRNITCCV